MIKFNVSNFIFFYSTFLKTVHPILKSFFIENAHKTKVIQIWMFYFSISVLFTLNALFFSDKYFSEPYKTEEGINYFFNIPKMIYSSILSYELKVLFNLLSCISSVISLLSKKYQRALIINRLKIRLILFNILKIMFIIFFWYCCCFDCSFYFK